MKRWITFLFISVFFLMPVLSASADRPMEEKPYNYLGAHKVVWCKEYISLREKPFKTSKRLLEIPLGAIVYNVKEIRSATFYQVEYEGVTGYALKGYLKPAPDFEPPANSSVTKRMTLEEVTAEGEVVLEWNDYNMSVVAAHSYYREKRKNFEVLRIGCFIDGNPIWGHEETVDITHSKTDLLKAFIGGIQDDWQVIVYNGGYGLSMLDLLSGRERWSVTVKNTPMGDGAAAAVDKNGTIYIAGSKGNGHVAISADGKVLWQASADETGLTGACEINVQDELIEVKYRGESNGIYKLAAFDNKGSLISVKDCVDNPPDKTDPAS